MLPVCRSANGYFPYAKEMKVMGETYRCLAAAGPIRVPGKKRPGALAGKRAVPRCRLRRLPRPQWCLVSAMSAPGDFRVGRHRNPHGGGGKGPRPGLWPSESVSRRWKKARQPTATNDTVFLSPSSARRRLVARELLPGGAVTRLALKRGRGFTCASSSLETRAHSGPSRRCTKCGC